MYMHLIYFYTHIPNKWFFWLYNHIHTDMLIYTYPIYFHILKYLCTYTYINITATPSKQRLPAKWLPIGNLELLTHRVCYIL